DSYLENGCNRAIADKLDVEKMVEAADSAAYGNLVPEAIPVIQALINGNGDLEQTLAWMAKAAGMTTSYVRGQLAHDLLALRGPLQRWGAGRVGGLGLRVPLVDNADRLAVLAMAQDAEKMEPKTGRKPAHDPDVVFWALLLADRITCRLSAPVAAGL